LSGAAGRRRSGIALSVTTSPNRRIVARRTNGSPVLRGAGIAVGVARGSVTACARRALAAAGLALMRPTGPAILLLWLARNCAPFTGTRAPGTDRHRSRPVGWKLNCYVVLVL